MMTTHAYRPLFFAALWCLLLALPASAQTTTFTYQGRLTEAGNPAQGNYDLQFKLFDTPNVGAGAQQGATLVRNPIVVSAGVFTVTLDFGANVFTGAARYLEIGVRPVGSANPYTVLAPRQPITAAPYALHSAAAAGLSAACVNCVTSGQIQTVDGAQVTGTIPTESVPTGSENYIQNATVALRHGKHGAQPAASFDIEGNGNIGGNLTVNGMAGIGTANPLVKLEVQTPTGSYGIAHSDGNMANSIRLASYVGGSVTGALGGWLGTSSNHDLHFFTNGGQPALTVKQDGKTGVGTIAPGTKLTVQTSTGVSGFSHTDGNISVGSYVGNSASGAVGGWLGTFTNHSLHLFTSNGQPSMTINDTGNIGVGTASPTAKLHVVGTAKTSVLEITGGSDLAEHFAVAEAVIPGMVVAIDERRAGQLRLARGAYNRRVAGVVSGANNLSTGMILPDAGGATRSAPVALTGRVWVYCNATNRAIRPGDLLTTAVTPGHAMKVTNYTRAQGAIIGKAMTELKAGKGLVLVLVNLQ